MINPFKQNMGTVRKGVAPVTSSSMRAPRNAGKSPVKPSGMPKMASARPVVASAGMSIGNKVKQAVSGFKSKVIDKVSDVMSYPARRSAQKSIAKSNANLSDLKMVKEAGKVEPYPNDYRSPLFRAKANVAGMKIDAQRAAQKAVKKIK